MTGIIKYNLGWKNSSIKLVLCSVFVLSVFALPVLTKAQVTSNGLVLWLKADKGVVIDNNGLDSLWLDQSGNNVNAFQGTANLRPSIVKDNIGGVSALRFSNGTFLNAPSKFPVNSSYTVITVISPRNLNVYSNILSGTSSRYFWLNGTAYPTFGQVGDSSSTSSIAVPVNFCTVTAIANDSSKQANVYVNGKQGSSSKYTVFNSDSGINIGAFAAYNTFEGDIAEVLVFNRVLKSNELNSINTYLNNKYGINLPAYKDITIKHFPTHLQFFQRDGYDSSIVRVNGEVAQAGYDSACLEVYKDAVRVKYFSQPLLYSLGHALFSFQPKIHAEMAEYSFKLHLKNGNADTVVAKEYGIVSGDAYIIAGQSNAVATSYGSTYISEYVRSFGSLTGYSTDTPDDTAWGYAIGDFYTTKGISFIGGIGIKLAQNLIEKYKIPLCIINGAVGGGAIELNLRNNLDPEDPTTIYGRMLYRMRKSGMDTSAKGLIWYHGASNTITNYYENFKALYSSWKLDYKNLKKFYVMQIRPGCNDLDHLALRELQRTLQDSFKDVSTVSVNNAPGHEGCHYIKSGYDAIGNWVTYLFEKDFYKSSDTLNIKPMNIAGAYYTDTNSTVVKMTFKEKNAGISLTSDTSVGGVNYNIKDAFYLDDRYGLVKSVSAIGDTLYLKLYQPEVFKTVTYLPDHYYEGTVNCFEGPWIVNSRGIGALAFYDFPIVTIPELIPQFHAGSVCLGQSFKFQDSSIVNIGKIKGRVWYFGDGDSSTLPNPIHSYDSAGNYQVMLVVKSSTGLVNSVTKTVTVIALPDPSFTYQLLSSRTFRFSSNNNGKATYNWDFGDGNTATGNQQIYSYISGGAYSVQLTVTNVSGCQADYSDSVHILFNINADFGCNNNSCLGSTTYFKDSSTISTGTISKWQWNFGDSSFSKLQNPWHFYKRPGKYQVTLTVSDVYGSSDTLTKIVTINPIPNARFTWTLSSGRSVQFQPVDSNPITNYSWNFGDGDFSNSMQPKHVYGKDGNYMVNLKAENGACWQMYSGSFVITSPLPTQKAFFSFSGKCTGTNTSFSDLSPISLDSITAWQWDFGDGTGSSAHNPQHAFSKPGAYLVQLKVLTLNGTIDSITKSVTINPLPDAGFTTKVDSKTMFFNAVDSVGPWYIWTFGDGFGSYYKWGYHTFYNYGVYNLTLAVKDSNGCINVHSDSVEIKAPVVVTGIENITVGNSLLKIFPNPVLDKAQITLETENDAVIDIKAFDLTGHLVSTIATGFESKGSHSYIWDAGSDHLSQGMYILKVRVGEAEVSRQMIKL